SWPAILATSRPLFMVHWSLALLIRCQSQIQRIVTPREDRAERVVDRAEHSRFRRPGHDLEGLPTGWDESAHQDDVQDTVQRGGSTDDDLTDLIGCSRGNWCRDAAGSSLCEVSGDVERGPGGNGNRTIIGSPADRAQLPSFHVDSPASVVEGDI